MKNRPVNPFNPSVPSTQRIFVGRAKEINEFREKLDLAKSGGTSGIIVDGDWGIGKTSLLLKYEHIGDEQSCFVLRIGTIPPGTLTEKSFANLIITNFQLRCAQLKSVQKISSSLCDSVEHLVKEAHKKESPLLLDKETHISYSFILREFLESFWEKSKTEFSSIIILIDEIDRLYDLENRTMFLREVLQRLNESQTGCLLVISGRKILAGKMSGEFYPSLRFFHPIELNLFSKTETEEFIRLRLNGTNITITNDSIAEIFIDTEGHPYVLSVTMMILYRELPEDKNEITREFYLAFRSNIFSYVSETFFKTAYESTTPGARELLHILAEMNAKKLKFSDIINKINKEANAISPYLAELVRKSCLIRIDRGQYKFFHGLFRKYVLEQDKSKITPRKVNRKTDITLQNYDGI